MLDLTLRHRNSKKVGFGDQMNKDKSYQSIADAQAEAQLQEALAVTCPLTATVPVSVRASTSSHHRPLSEDT